MLCCVVSNWCLINIFKKMYLGSSLINIYMMHSLIVHHLYAYWHEYCWIYNQIWLEFKPGWPNFPMLMDSFHKCVVDTNHRILLILLLRHLLGRQDGRRHELALVCIWRSLLVSFIPFVLQKYKCLIASVCKLNFEVCAQTRDLRN